jgi:hypothetical protein
MEVNKPGELCDYCAGFSDPDFPCHRCFNGRKLREVIKREPTEKELEIARVVAYVEAPIRRKKQ